MGFRPTVLCEFADNNIRDSMRIDCSLDPEQVSSRYALLLYHHSSEWQDGAAIVNAFSGPVVVRYHNVTPGEFFNPYAAEYEAACRRGRDQTARLAGCGGVIFWQAASIYSAQELTELGVPP